uniref:Uncharacterized protein n=1 Tax=Glossina palpalis gambiensis TaxID=67801 RepID=A0A1B0AQ82_9MUSC
MIIYTMESFEKSLSVAIKKEEKEFNEIDEISAFTNYVSSDISVKNEPITSDLPYENQLKSVTVCKYEHSESDLLVESIQKRESELSEVVEMSIENSAAPAIVLNKQIHLKRNSIMKNGLPIKKQNREATMETVTGEVTDSQSGDIGIEKVLEEITSEFLTRNESHPSNVNVTTPIEIKVKCLCRLGINPVSPGDSKNLISFFDYLFKETRCLSLKQQRIIKLSLLQAICGAENCMEEGKNCQQCCPSNLLSNYSAKFGKPERSPLRNITSNCDIKPIARKFSLNRAKSSKVLGVGDAELWPFVCAVASLVVDLGEFEPELLPLVSVVFGVLDPLVAGGVHVDDVAVDGDDAVVAVGDCSIHDKHYNQLAALDDDGVAVHMDRNRLVDYNNYGSVGTALPVKRLPPIQCGWKCKAQTTGFLKGNMRLNDAWQAWVHIL